ncbi:HdeA/HdeB family protein [Microbulbifer donghaiensis]|uniref:HdeA/HdeB family protein n=1 Tax=Microbulbifer donghaiensis TaxID=494016 RepID=A0A1M5HEX3_9GAMM|nr:acid-activated periplasmic chaperone HdeA [Microbulbifer donghaiensis]SHG14505.1 HdeA/HdeB family protein [Microbulbifer donghaiensis]
MKSRYFILALVIAGLASSVAVADKHKHKPGKNWTCEDFLALDAEYQPKAVYWATAFSKGGNPEDSFFDVEGTEAVTPMVVEACQKAPKEKFRKKLKDEWHKVDAKMKAEGRKMKEKM